MPLFTFKCAKCGAEEEHIVKLGTEDLQCENCLKGTMFRKYDIEGSVGIIYHCGGFYTTDVRAERSQQWQHRKNPEAVAPIQRAVKSVDDIDHDAKLRLCPRGSKVYTTEVNLHDSDAKPTV
jgi:predicted nucleic acid-binding Zn ribbon protein